MSASPNSPSHHSAPELRTSSPPSSNESRPQNGNSNFFLDDCPALLQQVPDTFDLGLTSVKLCSFAASPSGHYLAIGSQCGALFLFNLRIGQSIKPLRTNYSEVLSLLEFHCPQPRNGQRDQLAIGHQSGTIVLLALPSQQNPSFCQHVQEEAHRGIPLSAICWASEGRILFSGDHSGLLLATGVDFDKNEFPVDFVASEPNPILAIAARGDRLAFSSGEKCKIVKWGRGGDLEPIVNLEFGRGNGKIRKLAFDGEELRILMENGKFMGAAEGNERADIQENMNADQLAKWADGESTIRMAASDPSGRIFVLLNGAANLLICQFSEGQSFKLEFVDLAAKLGESNLQVVDICVPNSTEFFLLALPRRLLRIGRLCSAPASFTQQKTTPNVFDSLMGASRAVGEFQKAGRKKAQGFLQQTGTEEWLGRFNRELDIFLMGEGPRGDWEERGPRGRPKLGERLAAGFLAIPEPERLAQGFQQMIGQIRQSSFIPAEMESWSLRGGTPSRDLGAANRSLPTELSGGTSSADREELISMLEEEGGKWEGKEGEVKVQRRRGQRKRRRRGMRALAEEGIGASKEEEEEEEEEKALEMEVEMSEEKEQQMMKVLEGIMGEGEGREEKENDGGEERGEWGDEEEGKEASKTEMAPNNVLDLSELLAPGAPCSPSASSSNSPIPPFRPCPRFQSICRLPNSADCWFRLDCPFPVGHLSVCRHYLVICPKKRAAHRIHFLMAGAFRRNGQFGGENAPNWTPLRLNADALVVNELGTRIWRICNGVGYSPAQRPDPLHPSSSLSKCAEWCEMTSKNEGKLLQVAMNSQNAWYLTDRGVFVQMRLPDSGGIGIWFRAQGDEDAEEGGRHFGQLAASDWAVWGLNRKGMVMARTGMRQSPMGADWVEMDGQPRKFVSIGLFERTGFGLDAQGLLWFIHRVAPESPFGVGPWFKCPSPSPPIKSAPVADWRLQIGTVGIFLNTGSSLLHSSLLIGHSLDHVVPDRLVPNDHFALLTAGAFSGFPNADDCLFGRPPHSGELLAFSLHSRTFSPLPPLSPLLPILSICASPKWLLALDQFGIVHSRPIQGTRESPFWTEFGQPAKFISVAISLASIWAISQSDFSIWVAPLRHFDDFDSLNWRQIDGPHQKEREKRAPDQIRVSPSGQSVWVFSIDSSLVWTRTDLSVRNWRGRSWTKMNGDGQTPFVDLAVADSVAWALAKGEGGAGGRLHWMPSPKSSTIWRPLDFWLNSISVDSLDQRLWALDGEYRIVRMEMDIFPGERENEEGDWGETAKMLEKAREMPERTLSGGSADSWCQIWNG